MEHISKSLLSEFLAKRPFSIVHVDAEWNGHRKILSDRIPEVEQRFDESVSFGYVDCDEESGYARELGIVNVPSIAYYQGTKLCGVVIGAQQDLAANIKRLMNGEVLDQTNRHSRG